MVFASRSDYYKSSKDNVLQSDLSTFEGTYSNDYLEKQLWNQILICMGIREKITIGITSVFKSVLSRWRLDFSGGSTHTQFRLDRSKTPKKINDYYEVYFGSYARKRRLHKPWTRSMV